MRVAGANVGEIESVSVSRPGETVAYHDGKPVAVKMNFGPGAPPAARRITRVTSAMFFGK